MAILLTGILAKAFVGPAETLLTMAGRKSSASCSMRLRSEPTSP